VTWRVVRHAEPAAAFHARTVSEVAERAVWICDVAAPALVLGSAQRDEEVARAACAAAGVDLVRRRSGGGAVLVVPGEVLWVDLVVPSGDALWHDDVGRAFHWVGEVWAAALAELGVEADVRRGALVHARWSAAVCFAGLGPGEVTVDGHKVVGISQRRTRAGARFQCAALGRWDPGAIVPLLGLPPTAADDLQAAAAGVGVDLESLLATLVRHLP
jgi:lipoate-protein ligase A